VAENRRQSLKEQREQIKLEQVRYEATKKINDLLESGNDISKAYGVTLKEQLSDEGKVTNILKNRIDLTQQISDLKDEDIDHSEKAIKLNSKIKEVEEKLAGARDKKGKFQKGFNNLVEKGLITDIKMLQVERDKESAMNDITEAQKEQAELMGKGFDSMIGKVQKLPGGEFFLAKIGFGEEARKKVKKNFGEFAAGNKKFSDVFKVGGKASAGMAASLGIALISVGAIVLLFTAMFKIAKAFSAVTDAMGESFGVMGTGSNEVTKNLRSQRAEAAALGFGIKELLGVTTELSDNFGIGASEASAIAGKVLDSSKAMGLAESEGAKLFGTLMSVGNLTASQAEHLAESTYQLAAANNVNPASVMRDMADSAETIAKFGADNLDSIAKAAVQAKKMGLNLKTVENIAGSLLNFQDSLNAEIEASIMIGKQLNFQKARELALTGDLSGMMDNILEQVGGEAEFNKLNALERDSLAKSLGVSVTEMEKLASAQGKNVEESKTFTDLLGEDGMSALTSMINKIKSLGVVFIEEVGPEIEKIVGNIEEWLNSGGFETLIEGAKSLGGTMISIVQNMDKVLAVLGGLAGAAIGFMIGGPVGALIGAAVGAGAGYSFGSSDVMDVEDFSSDGSHLILTPKGELLETDGNDTVFGTTTPEKLNPTGGGSNANVDMGGLEREVRAMREEMKAMRTDNKSYFGIGGSVAGNIGAEVKSGILDSV
tara:strand:+ start:1510 stop:3651 length:2142 start_codon:yes stop_codon:yes gene_type:complete